MLKPDPVWAGQGREDKRMTVRILVCDDDAAFAGRLRQLLLDQPRRKDTRMEVTVCTDPARISDGVLAQFQLLFLDIDMQARSGLAVARRVRDLQLDALLIFVTNYVEFSPAGYEVGAFRYILKENLAAKLPLYYREALEQLARRKAVFHYFAGGEPYTLPYTSLLYFESRLRMVELHTLDGETRSFYGTMEKLEQDLRGEGFLRVHKSYLVNMRYIESLRSEGVLLRGGTELPVSRRKFSESKLCYMNWRAREP